MNFEVPELDPLRLLWFAVLSQAVEDVLSQSIEEGASRERDSARRWFKSTRDDVGSFLWVCGTVNLDSETVLQQVRSRYRRVN